MTQKVVVRRLIYMGEDGVEPLPSVEQSIMHLQEGKAKVCADVLADPRVAAGFLAKAGEQRLRVHVEEPDTFIDGDPVPKPAVEANGGGREEFRGVREPRGDAIRERRRRRGNGLGAHRDSHRLQTEHQARRKRSHGKVD